MACASRHTVYAYMPKFHLDRFIASPLRGENPQIWLYFQLHHLVLAPRSSAAETNSKAIAIPTNSIIVFSSSFFLHSNALMAKSCVHTFSFKNVMKNTIKVSITEPLQKPAQVHLTPKLACVVYASESNFSLISI